MASTRYRVAATTAHNTTAQFSRKEYAIREAAMRAKQLFQDETVTVATGSGKVVHTEQGMKMKPVVTEAPAPTKAAKKSKPSTDSNGTRLSLGESAVAGYDVLYEFPRLGAEIIRSSNLYDIPAGGEKYGLHCTTHGHTTWMETLTMDRQLRREGTWCPSCVAEDGPSARAHRRAGAAA